MASLLYPDLFRSLESVRWNMEKDVPWDRFDPGLLTDDQARTIKMNAITEWSALPATEMFLRDNRGDSDFSAFMSVWFFEEQKHALVLMEYLRRFRPDLVPYGAAKAGVIALTRSLARDYGKRGFRVNVLLPGAIRTPGTEALVRMAVRRVRFDLMKTGYDFQSRLPLGKWGRPDDVARMALVLASDAASYVQGAAIPVDGGFLSA